MASSSASTVEQYLQELPEAKRAVIARVRDEIKAHLPSGYQEDMQFGMITYTVPLSVLPDTYNKKPLMYAALAAQKNYYALYLMAVYGHPEIEKWFKSEYTKSGQKLDMGKSCVRFTSLEKLPLDLIGQTIAKVPMDKYVAYYLKLQENNT